MDSQVNDGQVELRIAELTGALTMVERAARKPDAPTLKRACTFAQIALYATRRLVEKLQPTPAQRGRLDALKKQLSAACERYMAN